MTCPSQIEKRKAKAGSSNLHKNGHSILFFLQSKSYLRCCCKNCKKWQNKRILHDMTVTNWEKGKPQLECPTFAKMVTQFLFSYNQKGFFRFCNRNGKKWAKHKILRKIPLKMESQGWTVQSLKIGHSIFYFLQSNCDQKFFDKPCS